MPLTLKPGVRLFSTVCSTSLIVVKAPVAPVAFTIGGVEPLTAAGASTPSTQGPLAGHDGGTAIGKRYVDGSGSIELVCTQAGAGTPAVDGVTMHIKETKPLPASD